MKLTRHIGSKAATQGGKAAKVAGVAALALVVMSCATPSPVQAGPLRTAGGPYQLEVLVDGGPAPSFLHAGESFVLGQAGRRYTLRVWNRSPVRVEAVVSVDGRDVVDGRPGDLRGKRGYLVPAWGSVDIEGWRLSGQQAAAFRFTSVADSYAARMGNARNVGVIGVALFPERRVPPPRLARPPLAPYDEGERDRDRSAARSEAAEETAGAPGSAGPPAATADGSLAARKAGRGQAEARPGLGTGFGESVDAPVREVWFLRASPSTPAVVLGLRYDDRGGLMALGIDVDRWGFAPGDGDLRLSADPFPASRRGYAAPPPGWRR